MAIYQGDILLSGAEDVTSVLETNKNLIQKFWRGTKEEYNALITPSADTLYIITDDLNNVNYVGNHAETHGINGSDPIDLRDLGAISINEKGQPNGIATLNEEGKVPAEQLPDMTITTTKEELGLENVDNTRDMDKPISTKQQEAIDEAKKAGIDAQTNLDNHANNINIHVSEEDRTNWNNKTTSEYVDEKFNSIPDWAKQSNKPTYTANEIGAIDESQKGAAGGVSTLDENGKLAQMPSAADVGAATPSYVDALALNANKLRAENTTSDVLYVDLDNPDSDANRSAYFNSAAFNIPSPTVAFGIRDVNFIMAGFVVVTAYCFITDSSARVYYNAFNKNAGTWMGWKEHATTDTALMKSEKPSGTYTGNGSAVRDPIETGGIGAVICVYSEKGFAIVATGGGGLLCRNGASTVVGTSVVSFSGGSLKISTADSAVNASGITYYYQVL